MWRPNYTTASLWLSAEMVADGGVMLKSSAASLFLLLCSVLPPRLVAAGAKENSYITKDLLYKVSCPFIIALAQQSGFDGLAAYLAEKCLVAQFIDMKIAGEWKH
ncbi:hypothetical protein Bca52824_020361 [Brassica carinata]|uniref:Uncharacterized protein n=1 Tax=Brassica carinata TaxID=52824 RepID=A0A8X7VTK2_BRACI|nr:hypothetical protein Bca52824_020361 [Brassica carinata]